MGNKLYFGTIKASLRALWVFLVLWIVGLVNAYWEDDIYSVCQNKDYGIVANSNVGVFYKNYSYLKSWVDIFLNRFYKNIEEKYETKEEQRDQYRSLLVKVDTILEGNLSLRNSAIFYYIQEQFQLKLKGVEIIVCLGDNYREPPIPEEISCSTSTALNSTEYWKMLYFDISEDGTKKVYFSGKSYWADDPRISIDNLRGEYYFFEEENWNLVKTEKYDYIYFVGILKDGTSYVVYLGDDDKYSIKVWDDIYGGYKYIFKKENTILLVWESKSKVLFPNSIFSEEYDAVFSAKELKNGDNIMLAWKWNMKVAYTMWEEDVLEGDFFVVKNWVETKIEDIKNFSYSNRGVIVECLDKFGYFYIDNSDSNYFSFDGVKYWEKWYEILNFYWFKEDTCEPLYVNISDFDDEINKLYMGKNLIYSSVWENIWDPKLDWDDVYFEVFKWFDNWYKLYKNGEVIEDRWWLQNYGILSGWGLVYSTAYNWEAVIKTLNWEKIISWVNFVDWIYISENKEHYALNLRSTTPYFTKLLLDWSVLETGLNFADGIFFKNNFLSVFYDSETDKNTLYLNRDKQFVFTGNPHSVMFNSVEVDGKLYFKIDQGDSSKIMVCK